MKEEKTEKNLEEQPFLMVVSDIFAVTGRGTVVIGRVKSGVVRRGDELEIVGKNKTIKTVAVQIEKFRQVLDEAKAGDNIGMQLREVKKEDIARGQVLTTPGTAVAHTKFEAKCLIFAKKEGGIPLCNGERLQFGINDIAVTGQVKLPEGMKKASPGDAVDVTVELLYPLVVEEGTSFPIFKNVKKIATGIISKILK